MTNATLTSPAGWGRGGVIVDDVIVCVSGLHTNPNTKPHRSVFIWIHPGTWFQKSAFSCNGSTGSAWTVCPDAQDLCGFTNKSALCGRGLNNVTVLFGVLARTLTYHFTIELLPIRMVHCQSIKIIKLFSWPWHWLFCRLRGWSTVHPTLNVYKKGILQLTFASATMLRTCQLNFLFVITHPVILILAADELRSDSPYVLYLS